MNPSTPRFLADPHRLFGQEQSTPASLAQREAFADSRADAQLGCSFIHSISVFLDGHLDRDALYSALRALIQRHQALRGRFSLDGRQFLIRERIAFELPVIDLVGEPAAEQDGKYARAVSAQADMPFDLTEGPLFRAVLVQRTATQAVLIFCCHQAAVDGWSLNVIVHELPRLYSALVAGHRESGLAPAKSLVEYLAAAAIRDPRHDAPSRRFWRETYRAPPPILELPLDRSRPRRRNFESRRLDHRIDSALLKGVTQAGARCGCSQFVSLLAAYALFLARVSGQDDLVVGVPAAGQVSVGSAHLICSDTRILPLRCTVREGDTFATFCGRLMDHFLAAYENQWLTLGELVRELGVTSDPSRTPLASVLFQFDSGTPPQAFQFAGLAAHHFLNPRRAEAFEIAINAVVEGEQLLLECVYQTHLFAENQMRERLDQLAHLMGSIATGSDLPVERLPLVPPVQIEGMERQLNSTAEFPAAYSCVDALIERSVRDQPGKIAVEDPRHAVSYVELWAHSGRVANFVLQAGLGPKPLIGLMLERSADMAAVMLGVWRAGGAFVPLDPAFPVDRLQYMVDHSKIRLLLVTGEPSYAPALQGVRRVDVSELAGMEVPIATPPAGRSAEDVAYVLYTSGSTGQPKGVKVPHRALNNFLTSMRDREPGMRREDRLLAVTTLSFDIAQLEIWLPLIAGATAVVADRTVAIDGRALATTLAEKNITYFQATPSTWRLLLLVEWEGDRRITALCGGEALTRDLADELLPRVGRLWNMYGPTETTVWSTVDLVGTEPLAIGKPIANTQVYVLDAQRQWVARGSIGELWIGGDGVALGYLGRDDLSAERFLPNPFTHHGRMYRTGDLVRLRIDGRIEFVGRNDFQVKINGYRIELPEVQQAMSRHPGVAQSLVVGRTKADGVAVLVGYYVARPGFAVTVEALRSAMSTSLPDYMLPRTWMELEVFPLTQNGKIDVKNLPDPFRR